MPICFLSNLTVRIKDSGVHDHSAMRDINSTTLWSEISTGAPNEWLFFVKYWSIRRSQHCLEFPIMMTTGLHADDLGAMNSSPTRTFKILTTSSVLSWLSFKRLLHIHFMEEQLNMVLVVHTHFTKWKLGFFLEVSILIKSWASCTN